MADLHCKLPPPVEIKAYVQASGPKGEKGDAFKYEDFTPEQLEGLRGPQGPAGKFEDLTPEERETLRGPKGDPGEKGDSFKYEDFTPEQLAALTGPAGYTPVKGVDYFDGEQGPIGPTGETGEKGETGATGPQGEPGRTPQKGIDYFTEEDVSEIAEKIVDEIEDDYLPINNPVATGSFSIGRKADTTIGKNSFAVGEDVEASGNYSFAEGRGARARGITSHAEGQHTLALGTLSHVEGTYTVAVGDYQHVQGKFNLRDENGKYAHIVGNGEMERPSNAHTLDWQGNAWFAGDVTATDSEGNKVSLIDASKSIFVAEYQVTSLDEIIAAYRAGRHVICVEKLPGPPVEGMINFQVYHLYHIMDAEGVAKFAYFISSSSIEISITNSSQGDVWSKSSYLMLYGNTEYVNLRTKQKRILEAINELNDDKANKTYVDNAIANLELAEIVDELPEEGTPNKLYLVARNEGEEDDIFNEYLWVNETWEYVGSMGAKIDLSSYPSYSEFKSGFDFSAVDGQKTQVSVAKAGIMDISNFTSNNRFITPSNQAYAAFYGLAKAAGSDTPTAVTPSLGTYTDDAKTKIKNMIGVPSKFSYNEETGMLSL